MTPEEEEAQLRWLDAQDDAKAVADTILRAYPELRVTKGAIGGLSPAFVDGSGPRGSRSSVALSGW